jgi:hypothetical protein
MPYSKYGSVYEHLKFNGIYQKAGCDNSSNLLNKSLNTRNLNTIILDASTKGVLEGRAAIKRKLNLSRWWP